MTSAHLLPIGSIVVRKRDGRRFEVLGPGLDLDTLRLRDVEDNGIWLNAASDEYERETHRFKEELAEGERIDEHTLKVERIKVGCTCTWTSAWATGPEEYDAAWAEFHEHKRSKR